MEIYEGKRHLQQQQSSKSSRSPSPEPTPASPTVDTFRPIPRTPPPRVGPPPSPPVPTHPVAPVAPEPPGPQSLLPCPVCGRTFLPQSLAKHEKICEKMTIKKRKTFDSSRQRREGTDLEQYLPKNFGLPENSPFLEKSPPNTAKVMPKPKPQSVRTAITKPMAELQKCPHCNRAFGVRAFERHVEWCGDKAKILPAAPAQPPPHIADAKQRLNARTQYKAPLVRGRRSSQTRDKSSNSRSASVDSSRGVSPPPPREYGDYRTGRTRASESLSSNDHEEASPHVPVIRNSRNSNNSSGDANVKARQARLARDLSSSRKPQESQSSVQPSSTDLSINKSAKQSQNKTRLTVKKKQQLKKLEELANKYKDKAVKEVAEVKKTSDKSQIPVIKKRDKIENKRVNQDKQIPHNDTKLEIETPKSNKRVNQDKQISHNDTKLEIETPKSNKRVNQDKQISHNETKLEIETPKLTKSKVSKEKSVPNSTAKEKTVKTNTKKNPVKLTKESSMSLDSLEEAPSKKTDKNCQSIGINTELLCPSIPCIIYENPEIKKSIKNRKSKSKDTSNMSKPESNASELKIELLYKNLTVVSSCNIESKTVAPKENYSKEDNATTEYIDFNTTPSTSDQFNSDFTESTCNFSKNKIESEDNSCHKIKIIADEACTNFVKNEEHRSPEILNDDLHCDESQYLNLENLEGNDERDDSAETLDVSVEHNEGNEYSEENNFSRHGSGETYTKFTESPEDLEEFLNLTDKMISEKNSNEIELERQIETICTPKTNSIEAMNITNLENIPSSSKSDLDKRVFSDTFEELKTNLKELLKSANTESDKIKTDTVSKIPDTEEANRKVCDMEHITVYQLKFYEQTEKKQIEQDYILENEIPQLKLPSISENNKPENKLKCNKKRMQRIYKPNRKFKMLGDQNRANTFIVKNDLEDNSDGQSITSEAPPLKLPRIENKRIDDNYDPFVSAARQMKELMSSDTNIPKKIQNASKDPNRTLPILRPAKEKTPSSYPKTDNTKMMKDTLNKTYQKTPTLQRMKSFGSTTNENMNNTIGSRCSSFRLNRNDKKSSQSKLNTTFTKSSKENVGTMEKTYFNRNSSLNRSFSSYTASNYSTPKPKDKIPKITTSMYHSFQRSTIKQPVKLDKIKRDDEKKNLVNLDVILMDDNSSMTDSNYIDPRLINENDNLPINVNTILNNPDIISSMESLLTTENLPAKFESFNTNNQNNNNDSNDVIESKFKSKKLESNNNNIKSTAPTIDDLSAQYDKIMSSLEQSIASKTSIRDDDSLCEDFDLEEFMTSFDEEINKQKSEKRTCSSTTRVVKQSELADSNRFLEMNSTCSSPKVVKSSSNGMIPVNKSMSLNFSSNNIVSESLFPSSVKRSTSLLDSIQKKNLHKLDSAKSRKKADQLEQDIMQSLKDFDKFYESERHETKSSKEIANYNTPSHNGTTKRDPRLKMDRINRKAEKVTNGNYTPNGKVSNDSAYSSLNRISPSKLSLCNSKEPNGLTSLEQIPAGSDSGGSHKEDVRSVSSEEFLAMERSAELDEPLPQIEIHTSYKEESHSVAEKRVSSRASARRSPTWRRGQLSSSGSESSLQQREPAPRLSRFCHECGAKFPVDSAKFCIDCGVKRLRV